MKEPTQFVDLQRPKSAVRLPKLDEPKQSHQKCEAEIAGLRDRIAELKDFHAMHIDVGDGYTIKSARYRLETRGCARTWERRGEGYLCPDAGLHIFRILLLTPCTDGYIARQALKGQLEDKTNQLKENSADINRLQGLCRDLQSRQPRIHSPRVLPSPPQHVIDPGQIIALEKALKKSERDAAACAQIAQAREGQAAQAIKAQDAAIRRAKDRQVELLKATRALADAENALVETEAAHKKTLELMKAAWTKREKDWVIHNEIREKVTTQRHKMRLYRTRIPICSACAPLGLSVCCMICRSGKMKRGSGWKRCCAGNLDLYCSSPPAFCPHLMFHEFP